VIEVVAMVARRCRRAPVRLAALVLAAALAAGACGGSGDGNGGSDAPRVVDRALSAPGVPALRVLAPERGGPWPVVLALHGFNGTGEDMVELATRVAATGAVVFVPSYRTEMGTARGLQQAGDDLGCAYRAARRDAAEYGGDLARPVTVLGWSLGADLAVLGSLGPTDPSAGRCPGDLPRPDVVVGISGCYYRFQDGPVGWFADLDRWPRTTASVHLVAGDEDTTCPATQTDELARSLEAAGYDVAVDHLASADHPAPVFHEDDGGQLRVVPDSPAGERVVDIVAAAIAAG